MIRILVISTVGLTIDDTNLSIILALSYDQKYRLNRFEKNFSLFDVYGADEAFVTGTFGGITPVTKIDGKIIGNGNFGSVSKLLSEYYLNLIKSEVIKANNG